MIDQVLTELDALSRRGEYTDEDDLVFVSPEGSPRRPTTRSAS
jgi:hypothetical protein